MTCIANAPCSLRRNLLLREILFFVFNVWPHDKFITLYIHTSLCIGCTHMGGWTVDVSGFGRYMSCFGTKMSALQIIIKGYCPSMKCDQSDTRVAPSTVKSARLSWSVARSKTISARSAMEVARSAIECARSWVEVARAAMKVLDQMRNLLDQQQKVLVHGWKSLVRSQSIHYHLDVALLAHHLPQH